MSVLSHMTVEGQPSIMDEPRLLTVDVRDMLCAQALAIVAQAVKRVRVGDTLRIVYNAEDVKRDLLAWAAEQRHRITEAGQATLQLTRER